MIMKLGDQTVCPAIATMIGTGTWTLTKTGSGSFTAYVLNTLNGSLIGTTITASGTYTLTAPVSGFAPVYLEAGSGYKFNYGQPSGMNSNAPFNQTFTVTGKVRTIAVTNGDAISVSLISD